jgi:hypothetical protein
VRKDGATLPPQGIRSAHRTSAMPAPDVMHWLLGRETTGL